MPSFEEETIEEEFDPESDFNEEEFEDQF